MFRRKNANWQANKRTNERYACKQYTDIEYKLKPFSEINIASYFRHPATHVTFKI